MVCFRYIIVNTLHKGDNKGGDNGDDIIIIIIIIIITITGKEDRWRRIQTGTK
jgi:hypothetical protein